MTYGYYLAATRGRFGDRRMSAIAARAWRRLGHTAPTRMSGGSAWIEDGTLRLRLCVNDLFAKRTVQYPPSPPFEITNYIVQRLS